MASFGTPALQAEVRQNEKINRAFSSAGSEHLPYKQGVGGSNPSTPTIEIKHLSIQFGECFFFIDMIYIALLRGINVGGKNIVDMKKLKTTFESLGFTRVTTYINSGNILFEDSAQSQDELAPMIEAAIKRDFQLEIKTIVINSEQLNAICRELPSTWVKSKEMRTDVMFLWEEFDRPNVLSEIQITPVDNVKYVPGAILWNVNGEDYSKSGMMKLMGTKLYRNMTIRNVNTVRKLQEMVMQW